MRALDPRTLDRIAEIIVDPGGDQERRGWQLERLLRHAGWWGDPPEYDGSPRIRWLSDALNDRAQHAEDIARVLRRTCDPLEYDEGRPVAEWFCTRLNEMLEPEGLTITYVSGRPVVGEIEAGLKVAPVFGMPDNLRARLASLIDDPEMIDLLVDRAEQSRMAEAAGAHLLALFGIGSFVEGALMAVLFHRDPTLQLHGRDGKTVPPHRAGLDVLLHTAHSHRYIELDAREFMIPVRDFRNYIHPRRQAAESFKPDQETVSLSWGPVHAVLNDLEQSASR